MAIGCAPASRQRWWAPMRVAECVCAMATALMQGNGSCIGTGPPSASDPLSDAALTCDGAIGECGAPLPHRTGTHLRHTLHIFPLDSKYGDGQADANAAVRAMVTTMVITAW